MTPCGQPVALSTGAIVSTGPVLDVVHRDEMRRIPLLLGCCLLALSGPAAAARPSAEPRAVRASVSQPSAVPVSYRPPLGAVVVLHPFAAPLDPYDAGKRGVDLVAAPGTPVLAAGDGTVQFAGDVAGRGVVVIVHADGLSTEYEPLDAQVSVGQRVVAGQQLGIIDAVQADCAPTGCLHWGARRAAQYIDPLSLLETLGPVRLLPWH